MAFCAACGHQLGGGRFCTSCGRPTDQIPAPDATTTTGSTAGPDTEERRAVRRDAALVPPAPRIPPAAADMPPPPRFPLYADEVEDGWDDPETVTRTELTPVRSWAGSGDDSGILGRFGAEPHGRTPDQALAALRSAAAGEDDDPDYDVPGYDDPADHDEKPRRRRRGPVLLALLLVAAIVAAVLVWSTTRGDDGGDDTATDGPTAGAPASDDVADQAKVAVPGRARPSREVDGTQVSFTGANLVDGDATTTWRVAGDASGKKIVLRFPAAVTVDRVGLINGYAKESTDAQGRRFDWYHGHRTVTRVVWVFDDGTEVPQDLERDRRLQEIPVDGLQTRTVTLRIERVGAPGKGRASRDFTAISEIEVASGS